MISLRNKRFLITGGSGFIGTNLVDALKEVSPLLLNLSRGKPRNANHTEYFVQADILDAGAVTGIVRAFAPDFIVHLAAKTRYGNSEDREGFRINTEGTKNIIDAAATTPSVRRLIIASSNVVDRADRSAPYAYPKSKCCAESIASTAPDYHFRWCIVRPCYVWGPWFDAPFKDFFLAIVRGRYVHPGPIDSLRFSGYSGNVVFQLRRLLQAPESRIHRRTFYLADYRPIALREWAEVIGRQSGRRHIPVLPESLVQLAATSGSLLSSFGWRSFPLTSERLQNMRTNAVDIPIAETEAITGPLPYSLSEGVAATIRWLREQRLM